MIRNPFRRVQTVPREGYDNAVARAAAAETRANGLEQANKELAARVEHLTALNVERQQNAERLLAQTVDAKQMRYDRLDRKHEALERGHTKRGLIIQDLNADIAELRALVQQLNLRNGELAGQLQDAEHELGLARKHLDGCDTAIAVADHDHDKRRENAQ